MKTKTTIVGNLVSDVKKSESSNVFYFSVAVSQAKDNTRFVTCFVNDISDKKAALLTKGSSVYVYGNNADKIYTPENGQPEINYTINVIDLEILFTKAATSEPVA